ncbi:Transposable element P transposase [Araneus ventricosus]|uniref:Transposable element P transposase n=1 Tax=Araneus ventricosus TaxID=182803 RepID=A0A4Y2ERD7_ARAVE|nr:Transposable element P transposase [Araneus ventricosus]
MARGIVKNWKQVLGYYFSSSTDKFSLQKLVLEAMDILQSCQLEVVSIVCDQGPRNQGLFKEMNVTSENPYFVYKTKKIFAMYDPPHLLKSVRNNLKNHGIYYEDTSMANTTRTAFANWKHIEQLYEMDYKNELRACRKLTKKHIAVSGLKKMNVKLAAQVLSHSVASALNLYILGHKIEENAKDTMNFVKNTDTLFDTVNSRTLKHQKKELRAVSKNSCHEEIWKKMVSWIKTWQIHSYKGRKSSAPCKNGWILTLNAFIGICQELLKKNKFVLTNRFNQDVVENTFSSVRRRGGFRDNPDAYEFRHTIHKVIITNFLKQSIGKNCQDDDAYALIDFSSFNKNELFDIIDSGDCIEESVQDDVGGLNAVALNSVSENVMCYIAGYFAKKYLSSDACNKCQKLMTDEDKILDNQTIFLYFKEYNDYNSGLKWPAKDLFQYFVNLHARFMSNFNFFYEKDGTSKKFDAVLRNVNVNFFDSHIEHKDKAQEFFISSFIRMMIKHKVKMMNDDLKPNFSSKKVKYF